MSLDPNEMTARLVLALQIAREAGKITLEYFRRDDLEVERKGDDTPVTIADRPSGRAIFATGLPRPLLTIRWWARS